MGRFEEAVFAVASLYGHQWVRTVAHRGLPLDFSPEGLEIIRQAAAEDCGPVGGVLRPDIRTPVGFGGVVAGRVYWGRGASDRVVVSIWEGDKGQGFSVQIRCRDWFRVRVEDDRVRFGQRTPGSLPLPHHIEAALEVVAVLELYFPEAAERIKELRAELPAAQERAKV